MNYNRGNGLTFVDCCVCGCEFLVSDAVAVGHPDDPPTILCVRCASEECQAEMEEMRRYAFFCARTAE